MLYSGEIFKTGLSSQSCGFSSSHRWMWELDYKESWAPKNWCFWTVVLRVPWTARRSNQSILKEMSPECSLEGLMLKLKLQYFGHLMHKSWPIGKNPDAGKDWRREKKEATEDGMIGLHYWVDGHEFEQDPGVGDGQESLACCSPWGCKELDTTERLNWTEVKETNSTRSHRSRKWKSGVKVTVLTSPPTDTCGLPFLPLCNSLCPPASTCRSARLHYSRSLCTTSVCR